MAKINLFTQIRLLEDLPKYGLIQGDITWLIDVTTNLIGDENDTD